MSLLSVVQGACGQLNIVIPTAIVAATDTQTLQLLQLAKVGGKDIARRLDWQILMKEGTFSTLAAETQVSSIASTFPNFARILDGTMFDRTQSRPVRGPLNEQQWQSRKALAAQVGVEYYFRIRGGAIMFNPVPPAGDAVYFEYVSNKWCQSSGAVLQATWAADTDTALIDEDLLQLDLVWRWLKAKGLDYSEEFRTFENAVIDLFGPDGGKAVVDMTGDVPNLWSANVPEGSWNL
jgi:hypothetical protein